LPVHQVVGLSSALTLATRRREVDLAHVAALKRQFLEQLGARLSIQVHGDLTHSSPYIVNFAIPGVSSEALINQLASEVALASGSACSSGAVEPSYVLRAMGIEGEALYGAVRLSFSRDHSMDEVSMAVERIVAAVRRIREL
jgi:cysteine desulfurase